MADWEFNGAVLIDQLTFINGIILNVPDTVTSENLANDPRVFSVEEDQPMELQATPPAPDSDATSPIEPFDANSLLSSEIPWGIGRLIDLPYDPYLPTTPFKPNDTPQLVEEARAPQNISDIRVTIFDTGADINHPRLGNVSREGANFLNMTYGTPMDDNGHGNHVAATMVGDKLGLSRGCKLYSARMPWGRSQRWSVLSSGPWKIKSM